MGIGGVQRDLASRSRFTLVIFFAHIYPITAGERPALAARDILVTDGLVARLSIVHDRLAAVELTDGRAVPRTALFIRPALHAHQDGLLAKLDCEVDAGGFARVDATGQSSVPGVWVAGNATNPRAQVITAAGEGSAAAIAINADLVEEDVRNALQSGTAP